MATVILAACLGLWCVDDADARSFHEINSDLTRLLRAEATAKSVADRSDAIQAMAQLYGEIQQHPKLADSDTLEGYRAKLRGRLLRIQKELERAIARSEQGRATPPLPEVVEHGRAAREALSLGLAFHSGVFGGPSTLVDYGCVPIPFSALGGAPQPGDYGQALVDLIQRTIDPDFWDVNGGPGTIVYYPQWHALVVRATSEVHHKIGGGLGGLRQE